jgi:replicative DNA helicase
MSEESKNTFKGYLGPDFQQKLIWQLLVEPEFCKNIIEKISIDYFDDPYLKRLFVIMLEYFREFEKVPNLQNKSIEEAIHKYKSQSNKVEEEVLLEKIQQIKYWNERVINKNQLYDGDVVRKQTIQFIKQQEYRKLAEHIITEIKGGNVKRSTFNFEVEEIFNKINLIGDEENYGTDVIDDIDNALREKFRDTIPTGIEVIDTLTGNGLGRGEIGIIIAPSGTGKALPNSTRVLTPNGWVKNGELKVNDYVIGSDGKKQRVLGVYPQGIRDIYRIDFTDKTKAYCDLEHLWSVNSRNQRTFKTKMNGKNVYFPDQTFQTLKTSEMLDDFRVRSGLNYRMPNIKPIDFEENELPIHPYVLGCILGDGCITKKNNPHVITSDEFIRDKLMNHYEQTNVCEFKPKKVGYKTLYRVTFSHLRRVLDVLNLYGCDSSTKFIPSIYLFNSVKNRELLLQGLIDTDGTMTYSNGSSSLFYTTVSEKLAYNVRELVLSLGGDCRIGSKVSKYKKNNELVECKRAYTLTISFPNNEIVPCTLPKKAKCFKYRDKYEYNKFIKNIEYSHKEEATCIYVENKDHLYVIDDYILTHNTTLLTKIANTAFNEGKKVLQIVFEDTEDQIKRKHYTLWSKIALSEIDDKRELVKDRVLKHVKKIKSEGGKIDIVKFSQEDTTLFDIKNWITRQEKKFGYKYELIVLDYLDCLEPNKRTADLHTAELSIIKSFEAMASEYNIPAWSAIQSNRCLDINTEVIKENNVKCKIYDLNVGDRILNKTGYVTVNTVHPIVKKQAYKIKLKHGNEIICSKDHVFPTSDNTLKSIKYGLSVGDFLTIITHDSIKLFDEIISIEQMNSEIDMIDISVDGENMFFGNSIYTHNSGFSADFVEHGHSGGNIKRIQKSHFVMSIAKPNKSDNDNIANIKILKARFAKDGYEFKDCIFNNDTLEIRITDQRYVKGLKVKKYDETDLEKTNNKINELNKGNLHIAINENIVDDETSPTIGSLKLKDGFENELGLNNNDFEKTNLPPPKEHPQERSEENVNQEISQEEVNQPHPPKEGSQEINIQVTVDDLNPEDILSILGDGDGDHNMGSEIDDYLKQNRKDI